MLNQKDTGKLPTTERSALKVPGRSITSARDDYARAIRLLIDMRDRAEMAARPPGERVEYTRQDHDQHLDDMSVLGRLIRKMAER